MSHRLSASRVATTELQPWAMLPNGPQWMNAGPPSSVCTRFGLIASFRSSVIAPAALRSPPRSEEHTSELQSQSNLVCRLLLEKKKKKRCTQFHARSYNNNRISYASTVLRV